MDDEIEQTAGAPPPAGDLGQLAQQTAEESAALRGPTAGAAAPATGVELRDRWGRVFDRALHATRTDGQPRLRNGRTLILKSGAPRGTEPAPKVAPAVNRSSIQLDEATPQGSDQAAAASAPAATTGAQPGAHFQASFITDEQRRAKARTGAKLLARGWRMVGKILNPGAAAFTEEEGADIPQTGEDWLYNEGIQLPVGDLALHLVAGTEYLVRVGATPQGRDRITDLVKWARATFSGSAPQVTKHQAPAPQPAAPAPATPAAPPAPGPKDGRDIRSVFGA
jgi:hypothetical protein